MSAVVGIDSLEQVPQVYDSQLLAKIEASTAEMLPLTADRKAILLNTLLATGGNLTKAARLLGMSRQNVHRWAQSDPVFAGLLQEALEAGTDELEERAYLRAMNDSDRMMEMLLKARRPEKYRETVKVETTPTDSKQLASEIVAALLELRQQAQGQSSEQLTTTIPVAVNDNAE